MLSQPLLTEDQFEFIKAEIDKSSIDVEQVKDDLLDHFCCTIETYMREGFSFETAYQKTRLQVCPNGLNEIGVELFLALNLSKIIGMQRVKYSLGLLLTICLTTGGLFKVMQWPGANNLLLTGITGFLILFLPFLAYEKYKGSKISKTEIFKDVIGLVSLLILGAGSTLKITHLPGGAILLVGGTALFTCGFLPLHFLRMYLDSIEQKIHQKPVKA